MKKLILGCTALVLLILLVALARARSPIFERGENPFVDPLPSGKISVMSFNVENLFDSDHDLGKDDFAFLPLAKKRSLMVRNSCRRQSLPWRVADCLEKDWKPWVVERKLQQIGETVLQVRGRGPDILVLQEIENLKILNRLAEGPLRAAGYATRALIEGRDPRGIDVAVLSRWPLRDPPVLHSIPGQARGILEVKLAIPEGDLTVLAFHFPSQFHIKQEREQAVIRLAQLLSQIPRAIAAGDSNLTGIESDLIQKYLAPLGQISHQMGCKKCQGTHYYWGRWSFFDWIFFSKELAEQVDISSITVPIWSSGQITKRGVPIRFNETCQSQRCRGVSDHLPIYAEFYTRR